MSDERGFYIPVSGKKIGRAIRCIVYLAIGFVPFSLGAVLIIHAGKQVAPPFGDIAGAYCFFLCAALMVHGAFAEDR